MATQTQDPAKPQSKATAIFTAVMPVVGILTIGYVIYSLFKNT